MSLVSNVVRRVLPNGLTLLVERNGSAPVVAAVTHVKAGYFDEPDKWVGISHVLEHMYFKGTQTRPAGELARETQRLGGYLNAGTIYDKTVYYTVLPAADDALARAVDLQGDALMHAEFDEDELSRELEVIIQEAKRKLDTPPAVAGETLYELLYAQHRIRRWRIGSEEVLRALTVDDLRSYYRTRYTPERTIVVLVGDLDVGHALDLAGATYGDWRTDAPHGEASPEEVNSPAPAIRVLRGDVERPIAVIGWRSVDALHPAATALDFAGAVLGSGRGSWLSRAVRTPGLASSARAFHYATSEVGVFEMVLDGDERRIDDAVSRSLDLVAQLREAGPADSDVERVRAMMTVQWSRRVESMDGRASLWAEAEALGGYALADEFYRRMMETTTSEVREAAESYLAVEKPVCRLVRRTGERHCYSGLSLLARLAGTPRMPGAGRNAGGAGLAAIPGFESSERVHHLLDAEVADGDHSQPPVAKFLGPESDQLVAHAKHRLRRPESRKAVCRIGQRQG